MPIYPIIDPNALRLDGSNADQTIDIGSQTMVADTFRFDATQVGSLSADVSSNITLASLNVDSNLILSVKVAGPTTNTITWVSATDKLKHSAGTFDFDDDNLTTTGTITSGDITILNPTPILVFQDSDSLGAASVGFIEWRDSGGGRAGFFGNSTSGDDGLLWKNEQGGDIGIQTTGAGKFQVFANTELNDNSITGVGNITGTDVDFSAGTGDITTSGIVTADTFSINAATDHTITDSSGNLLITNSINAGTIVLSTTNTGTGAGPTTLTLSSSTLGNSTAEFSSRRTTTINFISSSDGGDGGPHTGRFELVRNGEMVFRANDGDLFFDVVHNTSPKMVFRLTSAFTTVASFTTTEADFTSLDVVSGGKIRMDVDGTASDGYISLGEDDDFKIFHTVAGVSTIQAAFPTIDPASGIITIGTGAVGVDYQFFFDGENSNGVFIWNEGEDRFEIPDAVHIGSGGDETQIGATGDLVFTGGGGLPFGSFWGNDIADVIPGGTGSFTTISDGDITVGQTHLTAFQNNREIDVTNAGMYKVDWSMSVKATGANKHIVGGIGVDVGGAGVLVIQNDGQNHSVSTGNAEFGISGTAILDLSASSEVGLMVTNESDNSNVTVEHVALSVVQVGGT